MRFVYLLLTGIGVGLIVGGNSLHGPPPQDHARVLADAIKRLPPDQPAAAEIVRTLQSTLQQPPPGNSAERERDAERTKKISALLNGFGSCFFVIGVLGLLLSLFAAFEARTALQRPAQTPPQG